MATDHDPHMAALTHGLEGHFRHVRDTRMADVPILNPALDVQTVGFRRIDEGYFGALITPWFISLVILPAEDECWAEQAVGSRHVRTFPSGNYEFLIAAEESIGRYLSCSLLSPVFEIADQASAVATARAALQAIDDPECRDDGANTRTAEIERRWHGEEEQDESPQPAHAAVDDRPAEAPLSRRDFLRGRHNCASETTS